MVLRPEDIHLWLAFPDEIRDEGLIAAYEKLMSGAEHARYKRFRFEKDRRLHLVARALVRTTLSRYASLEPGDWSFVANRHGRPEIEAAAGTPPLRFNLSHTKGIVICGVALDRDIGVDVENHDRAGKKMDIAKRFFSASEYADLARIPEPQRNERFFHYWTLKESFIKAHGKGLSLPLDQFTFHLTDDHPLRISFDPRLGGDPEQWQFWLMMPTARSSMAVSLFKGPSPNSRLTMRKVVPLKDEAPFDCDVVAWS